MTYEQTVAAWKIAEQSERRALRKRAWFVGLSMLLSLAAQFALALLVSDVLTAAEAQMSASPLHRVAYYTMYGAYYCVMLLLPVAVMALCFRQKPRLTKEFRRPAAPLEGVLLVLFGLGFCILANFVTNYWLMFMEQFGVQPFEGDYHAEKGALSFVLNLITYAVLPGVVEEFLYRGWILGALQPCGERRALVLSALLFGLAHGNLTQLPFAFLLGLLFGYVYLRTGRLWVGVVIHFLNNAMSVVIDSASLYLSENGVLVLQYTMFGVLIGLGIVAGLLLTAHPAFAQTTRPLVDRRSALAAKQRGRLMWGNPAIVVTLVVYFAMTVLGEVLR